MAASTPSYCIACDYNLTGTRHGCCPECGQSQSRGALALAREATFFRQLRRRLLLTAAIVIPLIGCGAYCFADAAIYVLPLTILFIAWIPLVVAILCARMIPDE